MNDNDNNYNTTSALGDQHDALWRSGEGRPGSQVHLPGGAIVMIISCLWSTLLIFLDQIHFKFIFHQQLHQASNTNRTPPVSREIHVSLNCKYKISNYHSHQWQMFTLIMITKDGYVRLFVGGAEEMWERVKSSSPKFLYQTSDSANPHSAIIKISQCNYEKSGFLSNFISLQLEKLVWWTGICWIPIVPKLSACSILPWVCEIVCEYSNNVSKTISSINLPRIPYLVFFTDENQTNNFPQVFWVITITIALLSLLSLLLFWALSSISSFYHHQCHQLAFKFWRSQHMSLKGSPGLSHVRSLSSTCSL